MRKIKIGERWVGEGEPVFVVAEAGSNHDGKLEQAKALIDVAAEAGADAIKFQIFSARTLYSRSTPGFSHLEELTTSKTLYQIVKENELPRDWLPELAQYASEKGLIFLATPFDREAVDELAAAGVPAYKWASGEIVDLPLLRHAAAKSKPMLISTGMCNLTDIQEAVDVVYSTGNFDVILLHCTSLYPAQTHQVNLRAMDTLRNAFQVPVGFSDHTMSRFIPIAAVARGACIIEKHFTLSRQLSGPDHAFALEPEELKEMIRGIRETEESLGSPLKRMLEEEKEVARIARRSIIARRNIPEGTRITAEMLTVKRPGWGIPPKFWDTVLGRKAKQDIAEEEVITWEMV